MNDHRSTGIAPARVSRLLTAAEFHRLAEAPPEVEWFANLTNPRTRRVYDNAVKDFVRFAGITRRRSSARRPHRLTGHAHQARKLLAATDADTVKSKRDRAILSTLLFHALRRDEVCKLKVGNFCHARKGVPLPKNLRQGQQDTLHAAASQHPPSTTISPPQGMPKTTTARYSDRSASGDWRTISSILRASAPTRMRQRLALTPPRMIVAACAALVRASSRKRRSSSDTRLRS